MHAPEDRGYVHDCSPLDGDGRVQGGIGGGGDVDGVNADEAGGAHHLGKGECVALNPRFYKIGGCILHNLFFLRRRSYNVF